MSLTADLEESNTVSVLRQRTCSRDIRSTAANSEVMGGSLTGSEETGRSSSRGRTPIEWTELLREFISCSRPLW
jgi:hypothetical protein